MHINCIFILHLHVSILPYYHQEAFVTEYICLEMCLSTIQSLVGITFC
jgi:hypothetical protein